MSALTTTYLVLHKTAREGEVITKHSNSSSAAFQILWDMKLKKEKTVYMTVDDYAISQREITEEKGGWIILESS